MARRGADCGRGVVASAELRLYVVRCYGLKARLIHELVLLSCWPCPQQFGSGVGLNRVGFIIKLEAKAEGSPLC